MEDPYFFVGNSCFSICKLSISIAFVLLDVLQILIPTAFCQEMGDTVSPGVIQRYNIKQGPPGCKAH